MKRGQKQTKRSANRTARTVSFDAQKLIKVDPKTVQRVLNQVVKTFTSPEYQQQVTKLSQTSISNSLQVIQKMGALSGRLSKMDNQDMSKVVERSVNDLTKAFMQYNTDQLVLLQKLSARTIEILDDQSSEDKED